MAYETIEIEHAGPIGKILFNRPKVLNAYSKAVSSELMAAVKQLTDDDSVRAIVISGNGRAFMAGADINMVNQWSSLASPEEVRADIEGMFSPTMLEDCPKPVIAAINGLAFGMGCEIALGCDFRIAAQSAQFGVPEIKIGIIPGGGGTQRLTRLVGQAKALEMIVTGDPITAQDALACGLVNRVAPDDELWDQVEAFVGRLLDKSPIGIEFAKKCVYQGGDATLAEGLEVERDLFCRVCQTADAKEGTKAFLEKRRPEFKGK